MPSARAPSAPAVAAENSRRFIAVFLLELQLRGDGGAKVPPPGGAGLPLDPHQRGVEAAGIQLVLLAVGFFLALERAAPHALVLAAGLLAHGDHGVASHHRKLRALRLVVPLAPVRSGPPAAKER